MAYVLPTFNLLANVWHAYDATLTNYASPDATVLVNLSPGKRTMVAADPGFTSSILYNFVMEMLVAKDTDIRTSNETTLADLIECPKDTGRFYAVRYVDDIGKGFANEHRLVLVRMWNRDPMIFKDTTVPFPVPLP